MLIRVFPVERNLTWGLGYFIQDSFIPIACTSFPMWSLVNVSPLKETYHRITLAPYAASKFSIARFKLLTYYVVDVDDSNVFFLNDLPLYIVCMFVLQIFLIRHLLPLLSYEFLVFSGLVEVGILKTVLH